MGTFSAMFCRREVLFVFIGLTVSALTVSAQMTVAEEFQKCVTSCTGEDGYTLKNGNYPNCNRCNVFVQCTNGYIYIQECPLGTNYFNRKLGVCDKNISVCVNDSLTTKSTTPTLSSSTSGPVITTQIWNTTTVIIPTTTPASATTTSTTSETLPTTTSTSVMQTSSSQETTSSTNPTSATTTATTTTSETSVIQTTSTPLTTTTSPTTTSTPVIQTSSSQATTTPSPTAPTTLTPVPTVYIPKPGGEADSFWFAMDLYNNHSLDAVKVGALTVDSVSAENYYSDISFPSGTDYRLYGVTLIRTACANNPESTKTSPTECPLMSMVSGKANRYFVAKCHFKVRYSSPNTAAAKLNMMYMMCDK